MVRLLSNNWPAISRLEAPRAASLSDLKLLYGELVPPNPARRRCLASRAKLGAGTLRPRVPESEAANGHSW
jgi:hypothetical protein